jgi:hypothetical protein
MVMSHPEPTDKPFARRVQERIAELHQGDPTMAMLVYPRIMQEEREKDEPEPFYYAGNARRIIRQRERLRRRGGF